MRLYKEISRIIKSNAGLLGYTFLNYLDKFIIFCTPLLVLFIFNNKVLYNELEYIYSLASITSVLIELGVRNYALYEYKNSNKRDMLLVNIESIFSLQFITYLITGTCIATMLFVMKYKIDSFVFFITVRALFNYFISFYGLYYRLIDSPSKIFLSSIIVNILTVFYATFAWYFLKKININSLLAMQSLFVLGVSISVFKYAKTARLRSTISYISRALKYAWPITLNILLTLFISNYGKIYAKNILRPDDMTYISLIQRISMIIQLGHASAAGYYTKRIFLAEKEKIINRVFIEYSFILFLCVALTAVVATILKRFYLNVKLEFDHIFLLIMGYTVFWCYSAYLEVYINKINKNIYIPIITILSSCLFGLLVIFGKSDALTNISIAMFASALFNLILMILTLVKND